MLKYAWIIPSLPLISFFLIVFFGKRLPAKGAELGITAVAASFIISVICFTQIGTAAKEPVIRSVFLFRSGSFMVDIGENVDGLAVVMFFVVTLVSLCVQVYSTSYMHGDQRYTWYFAALSLYTGSMLNLVIADNLFQLLIGWELVGICSYLLIGHWWEEKENSDAAIKAFITTKTGDIPFLFGIFVLTIAAGTTNIPQVTAKVAGGGLSVGILTIAALLLFGGAIGKSAQVPLHVWLPDAMAGPTPVSALIHAATMVVAGVYMVARLYAVFAPSGHALAFVGTVGSITMLIAALLALVQDDIKRVLAYSTISQIAYMVAALGLGPEGYTPSLFHLYTHAFFKALLFLGAGSIIHAVHTNNMSEMGGLRRNMPITFWTFIIGTVALTGVPPFAGFFSKDSILSTAYHTGHYPIYFVGLVTAFLTALYMTRAIMLTFFGEYRGDGHPHESPAAMTYPMMTLALFSIIGGWIGVARGAGFNTWVRLPGTEPEAFSFGLAAVSIIVALVGIGVGYSLYATYRERDPMLNLGALSTLLVHKYYLDDIYLRGVVRPIQYPIARATYWLDQHLLDGVVNGTARGTRRVAAGTNTFDRTVVDGAVNGTGRLSELFGQFIRGSQTGNVQRYAVYLFIGVAVLAIIITRL